MKQHTLTMGRQRGIATLLVLLLVGGAVTLAIFGSASYVRGAQEQTTAFHTQTQAQMNAWSGVGAIHHYFDRLVEQLNDDPDFEGMEALCGSLIDARDGEDDLILNGDGTLRAVIHGVVDNDGNELDCAAAALADMNIVLHVQGISMPDDPRVKATSVVELVLRLAEVQGELEGGGVSGPPSVITFNRSLRLGGSINVTNTSGEYYEINVKGQVHTGGNSITGVDAINATDSISIGSGSTFKILRSNGDVALTGSVRVTEQLQARGNVCLIGGVRAEGLTKANGFVFGDGSAYFGDIEAGGQSLYTGGQPLCDHYARHDSHGQLFGVNLHGNNTAGQVRTSASVRNHGGSIPMLLAQGDLHNGYGSVANGAISGEKKYCASQSDPLSCEVPFPTWKNDVNVSSNPNLTISVAEVPLVEVESSTFDAYDYEAEANYAFRIDQDGYKVVTVRNIHGIPSGQYYVGSYEGPYKDRLCTDLTSASSPANPVCAAPAASDSYPLCWGYSDWNTCFSYTTTNNTWSVDGNSMAQGVVWFEGNFTAGNGTYYNTFIATGNIQTTGGHKSYAPNYAGYSGSVNGVNYAPRGICTNAISEHYPTQLCNSDGTYNPEGSLGPEDTALGNFVFMAGSERADGSYAGGNIALGASTLVYGSVLAGNEFTSGGSTTIHGYITALGSGAVTSNSMGGSTNIIVDVLPPTYVPVGGTELCIVNCGSGNGPSLSIARMWTRYR